MLAAILFLCLTLAAAQQPRPCEGPKQFEARVYSVDFSKNFTQFAKVSYDEDNQRVREVEEIIIGSDHDYFDTLYLHRLSREYRVNLKTRQCNMTSLTRPFRPFGIPPDARFEAQFNVGPVNIPNEHVPVMDFRGRDDEGEYSITVTSPDCIPVTFSFFSNSSGAFHRTFYDVVIGLPDPSVFDIPEVCR